MMHHLRVTSVSIQQLVIMAIGLILLFGAGRVAASRELEPAERAQVDAVLPQRAPASPQKARKLLVFDLNVNYGGHGSIPFANYAFEQMGQRTGAFSTVVSHDPSVFARESLRQFDAVFLNNNVGNLFEDRALRQNLADFVSGGGGLLGVHGTTVAFTKWPGGVEDWPEFGVMLGARGANHRAANERVFIRLEDPRHPLVAAFESPGFEYQDEFFRYGDPYSRNRVRVLLSIDTVKTDLTQGVPPGHVERKDNDYALAWVRSYGRGRVFYCTIAHNPSVFCDARMLQFYLAGIQFALGDLPAPTVPSGKLNAATRAQETLGWRLGMDPRETPAQTLYQSIETASNSGLLFVGGWSTQKVSSELAKDFTAALGDDELTQIRLKLDSAAVRLLNYHVPKLPDDDAECRRLFEFTRKMGIETLVVDSAPPALPAAEKLCDEFDMRLAIAGVPGGASSIQPALELCRDRSARIGISGDAGAWLQSGIDPVEAVRLAGPRLFRLDLTGLEIRSPEPQDGDRAAQLLQEIHRLGVRPTLFAIDDPARTPAVIRTVVPYFNQWTMKLSGAK
jgi:type 1 glutamine amidotransferase/sugar phosphate isomerase/epimerase